MQISVDTSDLEERGGAFVSALSQGASAALLQQGAASYNRIVQGTYWTNRTNATRKTFKLSRPAPLTVTLESTDKVAHFLNVGTEAHVIKARKAGALSFFWAKAGRQFLGGKVNHPGTTATKFVKTETEIGVGQLQTLVDAAASRAVSNAGIG